MEASGFLGTLHQLRIGLQAALVKKRVPIWSTQRNMAFAGGPSSAPRNQVLSRPAAAKTMAPAPIVTRPAPVNVVAPQPRPAPAPAKPPAQLMKGLRSVEEVRADLARLRENAKERVAQSQVRRDISFAPTDFMDFSKEENPAASFETTAFIDFTAVKARRN
jgi:hypothetical protein